MTSIVALEPTRPPPGTADVEIRFPFAEQVIPAAKARTYRVKLAVEGDPAAIQLVLDGHPGRPLRERTVELGALVPEGEALAEGDHLLIAFAVDERGIALRAAPGAIRGAATAVHFWVGRRGTPRLSALDPAVAYSLPRGTLNGDAAADGAVVDFVTLNVTERHALTVLLRGPDGRAETRVTATGREPLSIVGLQSGDWDVELALVDEAGARVEAPFAETRRTFTVNRDAPVGGIE